MRLRGKKLLTVRRRSMPSSRQFASGLLSPKLVVRELLLHPNDPEGLTKIIVYDLSSFFRSASSYHLGSNALCRPSRVHRGNHVSKGCAFAATGLKQGCWGRRLIAVVGALTGLKFLDLTPG